MQTARYNLACALIRDKRRGAAVRAVLPSARKQSGLAQREGRAVDPERMSAMQMGAPLPCHPTLNCFAAPATTRQPVFASGKAP